MNRIVAILNVIAWSGFWAFGYLALSADPAEPRQMVIAAVLAAGGFVVGLLTWTRICHPPARG